MIPSIGFMEMIVLALIAIVFVGPEDLPKLMRSLGGFMAKIRGLAQEFKSAFDEMGRETEMAELRKEIDELKNMGKLTDLAGDDVKQEMRELERDLRDLDSDIRDTLSKDNPKIDTHKTDAGKGES